MFTTYIGWIGVTAIAIAWIPEIIHVIKTKHTEIPIYFNLLYVIGSALLVLYSFLIGDLVFVVLNSIATISSLSHLIVRLVYVK